MPMVLVNVKECTASYDTFKCNFKWLISLFAWSKSKLTLYSSKNKDFKTFARFNTVIIYTTVIKAISYYYQLKQNTSTITVQKRKSSTSYTNTISITNYTYILKNSIRTIEKIILF